MARGKARTWVRGLAGMGVLAASLTAFGQPAGKSGGGAPAPAAGVNMAEVKKHFDAGVIHGGNGRWSKAFEEFSIAYKMKPSPQIAGVMAEAELHLGKYRDAAEHAERYLREEDPAHMDQSGRRDAEGWLSSAKKNVATLKIKVTVEGGASAATNGGEPVPEGVVITIDDQPVNLSPFPPEIYVEPGKHTIVAKKGNLRDENWGEFAKGSSQEVVLTPKAVSAGPIATGSTSGDGSKKGGEAPGGSSSGRTAVLLGAAGLAAVGIGVGIAGVALNQSGKTDRDTKCPLSGSRPENCPPDVWSDFENDRASKANLGISGFLVGGAALAAMGIVFFVWKPSAEKAAASGALVLTPTAGGAVMTGTW